MHTDVFSVNKHGEVVFLKYKALCKIDFINHAVSTRLGGVSQTEGLRSMNLGLNTADTPCNVIKNYEIFCDAAGFNPHNLVLTRQTHSTNVRVVHSYDRGKGVYRERDYDNVDALVTNIKNIPLVVHTADCVPLMFADTNKKAIGVAHCGWRGSFGRLAQKTLEAMEREYSTKPEDVICTVGPSICQSCYEVSKDLYDDFLCEFGKSNALKIKNDSYYIDLAEINLQCLVNSGLNPQNIIKSDLCTCCNTDYFYSHRGQGKGRGIFAGIIELV